MPSKALDKKLDAIRTLAREAINDRLKGTGYDIDRCLLGAWAQPDGVIVLYLNSGGNSIAVTHALWPRHAFTTASHSEYGVLIYVD